MTLSSFDVIDDIKEHLEAVCPSTVSCADIVALAGAESIFQVRRLPTTLSSLRAATFSQTRKHNKHVAASCADIVASP
jgi:hypothetical protein